MADSPYSSGSSGEFWAEVDKVRPELGIRALVTDRMLKALPERIWVSLSRAADVESQALLRYARLWRSLYPDSAEPAEVLVSWQLADTVRHQVVWVRCVGSEWIAGDAHRMTERGLRELNASPLRLNTTLGARIGHVSAVIDHGVAEIAAEGKVSVVLHSFPIQVTRRAALELTALAPASVALPAEGVSMDVRAARYRALEMSGQFDVQDAMDSRLLWAPDPVQPGRLRSEFGGRPLTMRENRDYPVAPRFSLEIGDTEVFEFDDFPPTWTKVDPPVQDPSRLARAAARAEPKPKWGRFLVAVVVVGVVWLIGHLTIGNDRPGAPAHATVGDCMGPASSSVPTGTVSISFERLEVVDCTSSRAVFRVVSVIPEGQQCPSGADYKYIEYSSRDSADPDKDLCLNRK
ncbi:hypothetical protein [Nocardia sp. NPDC052566]|uniref:LppU/SCO3897 family protein n=1 Tax=Nocardia sp. NPDC052566 TaxID=3364330 RepID=UPI0037CA0AC6